MSRKRKTSLIEDVVDVVAMLPWWAGVAIAVVSYLVLHRLATPAAVTAGQPGQISNLVAEAVVTAFASVGQYLVPFIGLVGAIISFLDASNGSRWSRTWRKLKALKRLMACYGVNLKCWWARLSGCRVTASPKPAVEVLMAALTWF